MQFWNAFPGPNAGYVLEQYERYLQDPDSVDAATRRIFERWSPPMSTNGHAVEAAAADIAKIVGAVNYANAIRDYGHLAAQLDPLGAAPPGDPALNPAAHGITEDDLRNLPASLIGGPGANTAQNALEAIQALRQIYASTSGYDFEHVRVPEEREWLRHATESRQFYPPNDPIDPVKLLRRLTEVEAFERLIHRIFPGKHRFSIEGLDMMVPIL